MKFHIAGIHTSIFVAQGLQTTYQHITVCKTLCSFWNSGFYGLLWLNNWYLPIEVGLEDLKAAQKKINYDYLPIIWEQQNS